MTWFFTALHAAITDRDLVYLTELVAVNVLLAVSSALASRTFSLAKLGDFVETRLLPVWLAFVAVALIASTSPTLAPAKDLVAVAIATRLLSFIASNLSELGIPIPSALLKDGVPLAPLVALVKPVRDPALPPKGG